MFSFQRSSRRVGDLTSVTYLEDTVNTFYLSFFDVILRFRF